MNNANKTTEALNNIAQAPNSVAQAIERLGMNGATGPMGAAE